VPAARVPRRAAVARGEDPGQIGLELVELGFEGLELLEHRRARVPGGPDGIGLKAARWWAEPNDWDGWEQDACQGWRSMNVTTIGRGLGGSPPSTQTESAVQTVAPVASQSDAGFVRIAWFDLNGDGHIDNRNPLNGGDGTLIVPKHAVDVPTYSRSVRRAESRLGVAKSTDHTASKAEAEPVRSDPAPVSDAQTRQAIDAYQRYGQPSETDTASTERAVA
jgi:hypothetical protein